MLAGRGGESGFTRMVPGDPWWTSVGFGRVLVTMAIVVYHTGVVFSTTMAPVMFGPVSRTETLSVVPFLMKMKREPRAARLALVFPDEIHNNTDQHEIHNNIDQHRDCEYCKDRIHVLVSFFSASD